MRLSSAVPRAARAVAALLFALFCLYSAATPLFEASDELWHYPMVMRLATGGGLPVQRAGQTDADAPWRQEGSQPPLYYAIAALASAPFDHSNWRELRRLNPHADLGVQTSDGNVNAVLHAPAEAFPWRGAALAARAARLISILLSTGTALAVYAVARELLITHGDDARRREQTLAAMLFAGCVPMFAFISGSINNDNAAALFSTLGLWWALRLARTGERSARSALVAGAIAALGALSKSSALGLLGLFALATVAGAGPDAGKQSLRPRVRATALWLAVMIAMFALIAGWWFARNLQLYGDALGWSAFLDAVGRRDTPATLSQLWTEREGFVRTYWGVFGAVNVGMPDWIYVVLNGLLLAGVAGCAVAVIQALRARGWRALLSPAARAWALAMIWAGVIFVALLRWTALTPASQGRLMFPAIAVIAVTMAHGLARLHRAVLWLGVAIMAVVAITMPLTVIAPAYARPANIWARREPVPVAATFDGVLRLDEAGFDSAATLRPGGAVTLRLNWEISAPLAANASVFVHLIDDNDVIVAQRDMYPGQGNLALAEVAAPYRWSDRYTLHLPRLARAPAALRWAVGVYDAATGRRLTLPDGADRVIFAGPALAADAQPAPAQASAPALSFANGVDLLRIEGVQTAGAPGQTLTLRTRWRLSDVAARDVNVSFQIIDAQGKKAAQSDSALPLTGWRSGEATEVTHELRIEDGASPGIYRLLLVMYVPEGDFAKIGAYDERGILRGVETTVTQFRVRTP